MAIPDVLVTLRFRLVCRNIVVKLWSTIKSMFNICFIFISFLFLFLLSDIQISMISVNFSTADIARTHLCLSCYQELNFPKLYRCRFLILLEQHFAFQYLPGSAIARASFFMKLSVCNVKPEIVVYVSIDHATFHSVRVVGFFKTYPQKTRIERSE